MEVIRYRAPTSWEDKGMNWNSPDPTNADYIMAIRQALIERYVVLRTSAVSRIFRISPWQPVTRAVMSDIALEIWRIAGDFVNLGWEEFEDDLSDFPKMWSYEDIIKEEGCRIYEFAKYGSLVENGGEWLKCVRNVLDKLTVVKAGEVYGRSLWRAGSRHDPPFDESIGSALEMALAEKADEKYNARFPTSVYAWSGNTHWNCPDPRYDGPNPEENVDGYCGYAESQAYRITAARSWLRGAAFDIFAAVEVGEPTGAVPYSQQLDTSVFDSGRTGYSKGLNWTERVRVKDPYDFEFALGDADTIPRNQVVPTSEFDGDGVAIRRHSSKRGWQGRCWGFLDYGVEGGFRFHAREDS